MGRLGKMVCRWGDPLLSIYPLYLNSDPDRIGVQPRAQAGSTVECGATRRRELVEQGGLRGGHLGAGGLELGERPGDLALIPEGGRQDHPVGHLDRDLRLDVDRLLVVLVCGAKWTAFSASGRLARGLRMAPPALLGGPRDAPRPLRSGRPVRLGPAARSAPRR